MTKRWYVKGSSEDSGIIAATETVRRGSQHQQQRVDTLIATVPADAWQRLSAGEGSQGPRWYEWACVPLASASQPGRSQWVLARRSVSDPGEVAYYRACGPAVTPLTEVMRVAGTRWAIESTFHDVRDHLGVETNRGWSETTIRRTTPTLLALFSLVTLLAHDHLQIAPSALSIRQAAWYHKRAPTFSDTLALVRRQLWTQVPCDTSPSDPNSTKVPQAFVDHLCSLLAYAA